MRVALLADLQINCGSKTSDRAADARKVLYATAVALFGHQPDYIVLAGDIFERYQTTDDEDELYVGFIHKLLEDNPKVHIIVIDGNHDIRHRGFNYFDGDTDNAKHTNVLEKLNKAINNPRYHYNQRATFYSFEDAVFACWSELAKFDSDFGNPSPWREIVDHCEIGNKALFEVYHGTVTGAAGFQPRELAADDYEVDLVSSLVLLGHIHKPQLLNSRGKTCLYPSSLLIRTFDEGARWHNGDLEYDNNKQHGYMLIDDNKDIKFVSMNQPTEYVTMHLDANCTKEHVEAVLSKYAGKAAKFKLVIDSVAPEVLSYCYTMLASQPYWKLYKTEAIGRQLMQERASVDAKHIDINTDSFVAIAKELLPDMTDKTEELLRSECGYHLQPDTPQQVSLQSVVIDNFKTIDHAELDLLNVGLHALLGNNGNGKTSVIEAINFACTGQHNGTFKHNKRVQQYIKLFNDKRPEVDTVRIAINYAVNAKQYTATTILTKIMKNGWTVSNWKAFVQTVNKEVRIECDDVVIAEGKAAEDMLVSVFGNYQSFAILHSINQNTLDNVGDMDSNQLANFMLQRLGYAVLERLQFYYQGCKDTHMQEVRLTDDRTYVQLQQDKDALELAHKQLKESHDVAVKDLEATKASLQTYTDAINNERQKLIPVDNDKCNAAQAYLQQFTLETAKQNLEQAKVAFDAALAANNSHIAIAKQLQSELQRRDAKYAELVTADKAAKQADIDKITSEREQANVRLASARAILEERRIALRDNDASIAQAKQSIDLLMPAVRQQQAFIDKLQSELAELESQVCPTCKQIIANNGELVDAQKKQIAAAQAELDRLNLQLSAANSKYAELSSADKIAGLQRLVTLASAEVAQEEATLNKLELDINAINAKPFATTDADYLNLINSCNKLNEQMASMQTYDIAQYGKCRDDWQAIVNIMQYADDVTDALQKNAVVLTRIGDIQSKIDYANKQIADLTGVIARQDEQLKHNVDSMATLNNLLTKRAAYDDMKAALKQYQWLVFDGLPKYLYSNAVNIVNAFIERLNLPDSICPRLSATDYGTMLLFDRMHSGETICRTIQAASGMELTISALALCLALHSAKLTVDFPLIMIDEVTGKLNSGTEYDPTDYLALFKNMLQTAAKYTQLIVVDHRLDRQDFDKVFDVIKDQATNTTNIR